MKYAIVYEVAEDGYKVVPYSNKLAFVVTTFSISQYDDEYDFLCTADELCCQGSLFKLNIVLNFIKDKYPSLFPLASTSFYKYVLRKKERLDTLLIDLEGVNVKS